MARVCRRRRRYGTTPRRIKAARAAPAGLHTLGSGREVGAPWATRVLSVTPDGCNQPTHRRGLSSTPARRRLSDYVVSPHRRWHQPLSHGATRRDSSPFRGAKAWAVVCGDGATVYHDADTFVSLTPVRGGVLDAPRSRDCRGGVVADVRPDQLSPRFPRRARLRPPPNE